ncbi:hypothetical protein M1513_00140 [Patescibacteria group bacterium]|nr:hypothetical protein [Patescibacteria group bacterium]
MASGKNYANFRQDILNFGSQLSLEGVGFSNLEKIKKKEYDALVVLGMGGSGLVGNILRTVKKDINLNVPIILHKNYGLPEIYHKNPFYLVVSFSGNTEETLSGLNEAVKNNKSLAVIAGGGKLKKEAEALKLPLAVFSPAGSSAQPGLTPRQSISRMSYISFKLLKAAFPSLKAPAYFSGGKPAVEDLILPKLLENSGREIASKIKNCVVAIYTDESSQDIGYIWKINLNETAKMKAFANVLPEMSHNEIGGFEIKNKNTAAIFFEPFAKNIGYQKKTIKKISLVKKVLKNYGVRVIEVNWRSDNNLGKLWEAIILSGWVSYYCAKENKVNPYQTKIIENLKNLMKK